MVGCHKSLLLSWISCFSRTISLCKMKFFSHFSFLLTVVAVIFHLKVVQSGPVDKDSTVKAFYYLQNYGYIDKSSNQATAQLLSEEGVTKAVKDFQVCGPFQPFQTFQTFSTCLTNSLNTAQQNKGNSRNWSSASRKFWF